MEHFLEEVGFDEWNLEQDRGRSFQEAVAVLSQRFPQHSNLIHAFVQDWENSIRGVYQESIDILWNLKQAGYPVYGLSNWSVETFQRIRPKYAFLGWFDDILLSGEVKLVKPDERFFQVFLERIGRKAQECLLVDDSLENITAARQMGFDVIHHQSSEQLARELRQRNLL
jgi:2-haloacid dehalogenase